MIKIQLASTALLCKTNKEGGFPPSLLPKGIFFMNPSILPSLSTDGWVFATAEKADYLISHFFVAEFSQTQLYVGYVSSFPKIIQNNQGNMTRTIEDLKSTLTSYFSRYFTNVVIDVSYKEVPEKSGKVQIDLYVSFVDHENKKFVLSRLVDINNTKIERILKINNTESV